MNTEELSDFDYPTDGAVVDFPDEKLVMQKLLQNVKIPILDGGSFKSCMG